MGWYRVLGILIFTFLQTAVVFAQKLKIVGQNELRIARNTSLTISLSDIHVEADRDLNYPTGFYLEIDDGKDYNVNGRTITPTRDYTGNLKVKIRVTNGSVRSDKFNLKIKVHRTGNNDDDDDDEDDEDEDDDEDDDNDNDNHRPVIVNQVSITINKNETFTLRLTHLVVSDHDDSYPDDFTLKVEGGSNYSVSGTKITPMTDFVGTLEVRVRVNDGKEDSNTYKLVIKVKDTPQENVAPIITGHSAMATFKGKPVELRLGDLSVTDPDDNYPSGFSLSVLGGQDYTVSGVTITPSSSFLGTLAVRVKVNDGKDDSNIFNVRVQVIERGRLQILGQAPITIPEDSSYTVKLKDLNVNDPSGSYPSGYTLLVMSGEQYEVDGTRIIPTENFNGDLRVPVKVGKDGTTSDVYELLVIVEPVNDVPGFENFTSGMTSVGINALNFSFAREVRTRDVDNTTLAFADIQLHPTGGILSFNNTENLKGVFDPLNGVLVFIGDAPLEEYDRALQSLTYSSVDSTLDTTTVSFRLNDGISYSNVYKKTLINTDAPLNIIIPNAFTPNNDQVNDTWEISLLENNENTIIDLKVYNKNGIFLFSTNSFGQPWDGRYNGEVLPADSYFYTLTISQGEKQEIKNGVITILR